MNEPITITAAVASRIDPVFVREYLLSKGWQKLESQGEHAELFTCPYARQEFRHDALIVYRREYVDYLNRMYCTVRDIALAENVPLFDVIRDLDPLEQKRTAVVEMARKLSAVRASEPRMSASYPNYLKWQEDVETAICHVENAADDLQVFEAALIEVPE